MRVTVDEVRRITSLARLRLIPDRERELVPQMAEIVRFAGEMERVDPGGLPGDAGGGLPSGPTPREAADEPACPLDRERLLANAPDHRDGHVRLPPLRRAEEP